MTKPVFDPPPSRLYHARRAEEPVKQRLDPTRADPQWRNGVLGCFLFATPRWDQAVLYALPFPNAVNSFMTTLDGNDPTEAIARFDSRPSAALRSQSFSNRIYSVDAAGFELVKGNEREWISPVGVDGPKVEAVIDSVDAALAAGIQYFTSTGGDGAKAFGAWEALGREGALTRRSIADELAKEGCALEWGNERDGLGLDPELAALAIKTRIGAIGDELGLAPNRRIAEMLAQSLGTTQGETPSDKEVGRVVHECSLIALEESDKAPPWDHAQDGDMAADLSLAKRALVGARLVSALYGKGALSRECVEARFSKKRFGSLGGLEVAPQEDKAEPEVVKDVPWADVPSRLGSKRGVRRVFVDPKLAPKQANPPKGKEPGGI